MFSTLWRAAANTRSTDRFRPLTLDDLADVAEDASARRDVGPAVLSAVPPRAPIGHGETVAVANVALEESADRYVLHSPTHDFVFSPLPNAQNKHFGDFQKKIDLQEFHGERCF